jgi:hypothetical protein
MTQYIYATRKADGVQHLLETRDGPALCGATAERWHVGEIPRKCFPVVPLCEACKLEREARKADARAAELRAQVAAIKTYWLQERTS